MHVTRSLYVTDYRPKDMTHFSVNIFGKRTIVIKFGKSQSNNKVFLACSICIVCQYHLCNITLTLRWGRTAGTSERAAKVQLMICSSAILNKLWHLYNCTWSIVFWSVFFIPSVPFWYKVTGVFVATTRYTKQIDLWLHLMTGINATKMQEGYQF